MTKDRIIYELKDASDEVVEVGFVDLEPGISIAQIIEEKETFGDIKINHGDSIHFTHERVPA